MIYDMDLFSRYGRLIGIREEWKVANIKLDMAHLKDDIYLDYAKECAPYPKCGTLAPMHDTQEERVWRHLGTMQFTTLIRARPPRCECERHGAKVIGLPWTEMDSRFRSFLEAFAMEILKCKRSNADAARMQRLGWHQMQRIREHAVERGLAKTAELTDNAFNPVRQFMVGGVAMDMSVRSLPNHLTVVKVLAGNANIRNPVIASYVAEGLLPYWGLDSSVKRAKAAWSAIAFICDKPGEEFRAIVSFASGGSPDNGSIETINETTKCDETIKTIKASPGISLRVIAEKAGKNRATVSRALSALKRSGIVECRSSKKTGGYYLNGGGE